VSPGNRKPVTGVPDRRGRPGGRAGTRRGGRPCATAPGDRDPAEQHRSAGRAVRGVARHSAETFPFREPFRCPGSEGTREQTVGSRALCVSDPRSAGDRAVAPGRRVAAEARGTDDERCV